jgi:hypothetical protein
MATVKDYLEFIDVYRCRIKQIQKHKEESNSEVEIDAYNIQLEFNLNCLKTAVQALENKLFLGGIKCL